ncbi:MAG: hypothetical protein QOI50_5201, partial [Pseudonocardiales bacterium]|nr:hypothetical protein [Pseudonocardiales bacterium]
MNPSAVTETPVHRPAGSPASSSEARRLFLRMARPHANPNPYPLYARLR